MTTVYLGCHFHDPDNPQKVVLIELDGSSFTDDSLAATLHSALHGGPDPSGLFAPAVRQGHGGYSGEGECVHLYLWDLAQSHSDLHTTVAAQLRALMSQGRTLFDGGQLNSLTNQKVGWLLIEMAHSQSALSSDPWG